MNNPKKELTHILEWTREQLRDETNPPWAWFQYMKLYESIETVLRGLKAVNPMENLRQSEQHRGKHLQLVEYNDLQDTALPRPADGPVQLPM